MLEVLALHPAAPPRVTIDLNGPSPAKALYAALTWPHDPEARNRMMAFYASGMLAKNARSADVATSLVDQHLQEAAEQHGMTVAALLAAHGGEQERQKLIEIHRAALAQQAEQEILLPAGGHEVLSEGPGLGAIEREIGIALSEGHWVGKMLCYLRQLEKHHPEQGSSVRNAWRIIAAERRQQNPGQDADRSYFLRTTWEARKSVAPLFAARLVVMALRQKNPGRVQPELTRDEVRKAVSYAKWFRRWLIDFRAYRSKNAPLIDPITTVEYDCPVGPMERPVRAMEPPLEPLSEARLKWLAR